MSTSNMNGFIQGLTTCLLAYDRQKLVDEGIGIITSNNAATSIDAHGFIFEGERHNPHAFNFPKGQRGIFIQVHTSLYERAVAYVTAKKVLDTDERLIQQVLFNLLHQACNPQELRDSLPDAFVQYAPELLHLPRTKTRVTWLIDNNKYMVASYEKILPKIEMYSLSALMH